MLEVRLFGRFEVRYEGKPVHISSRPAQSLFAYLILSAGTFHRREKLAGLLWPDSLEETARDNLRHALWRLRKALQSDSAASYLQANDLTIAFDTSAAYWLDVAELEKPNESSSTDELIAVLSNYQGELLPGFYEEWVVLEREHLNSVFEKKMARLLSRLQNEHRWLDILDWSERWIKLGQKPEPAYRALMLAHAAKGDMSKVAATYERCLKSLREFGIEPSEQTRVLYERLKLGKETLEPISNVTLKEKRRKVPKTNLPIPLTSFIGRAKEVEEIMQLVNRNRLVTLTGPGGIGKTRLAIQAAKALVKLFKNGVWWVDLAPLTNPALVPAAVAATLKVREIPSQPLIQTLAHFLRSKQLLLVLDSCEHLISACAQTVDKLLGTHPDLKILATSREALGLTGEDVWSVPILSLPNRQHMSATDLLMQYEGIRLFVERARVVRSDFSLTERNALSVVHVCQWLDGIPLAIELAAARVKMMSVDEIAKRLDDRFSLLTGGSRAALPRHQTLRAAIDWSYDLLSQPERSFLNRLSVFAGGFSFEAAEEVATGGQVVKSQVTDLLGQLINKSLITVEASPEDGVIDTRYRMLETIRQFAHEKFLETGEAEQVRQRHRDYFIAFVEQAEPELKSAKQLAWLDHLEMEQDNVRAAWDSAIESDADLALRLASALLDFWLMRGNPSEGRERLAILLERTREVAQTARYAHALSVAGRLAHFQADHAAARSLLEQALSIARGLGDKKETAFALLWLGRTALRQGEERVAQPLIEEGFTMYRELQDEEGIVMALHRLAELAGTRGDYGTSEEFFLKVLAKYRDRGDRFMAGAVLNALGETARVKGDYESAGTFYEQALEILRELRSHFPPAHPLFNLGWVTLHRGDYRTAKSLFEECLQLNREYGDTIGMVECLSGFAAILGMTGHPKRAARLFGAVEALPGRVGMTWRPEPPDQKEFDHYVAAVHARLDEATFARAWAEGQVLTLEQAIECALREAWQ